MTGDGDMRETLGEMTSSVEAMRVQNDRMDREFREFRTCVRGELTAIRKALASNTEKITLFRAVGLVIKWAIGIVLAAIGLGIAYKSVGK